MILDIIVITLTLWGFIFLRLLGTSIYFFFFGTVYLNALFFDSCFARIHWLKSLALPGPNLSLDRRSAFSLFPSSPVCCPHLLSYQSLVVRPLVLIFLSSAFLLLLLSTFFFFLFVTHHPTEGHLHHVLQVFSLSLFLSQHFTLVTGPFLVVSELSSCSDSPSLHPLDILQPVWLLGT